ncbi:MAG: hypothetical protein P4L64_07135 [Caulobacteraceae bacterium]|nr:hypothetical protein [Caulobacteraceae bacterium]
MSQAERQMRLGAFLLGIGHHLAAWRDPKVDPANLTRFEHYRGLAEIVASAIAGRALLSA